MLEILSIVVKPKLIFAALSNITIIAVASCWLLLGMFAVRAWHVLGEDQQGVTLPEVNQHLMYDDKRIDTLSDDIRERIRGEEQDRNARRDATDARYKDLSSRLQSIEHDVTFIYGGGIIGTSLVTILLTLNVIKVNRAEQKIKDHPIYLRRSAEEDLQQADLYADFLRTVTAKERARKERGEG